MIGYDPTRQWMNALLLGLAIGACALVISAASPRSPQDAPAFAYNKNDLGIEFAMVPPGQFQMGCSEGAKAAECSEDERPRHAVRITKAFEIGKTEVTQKQWQAVMGTNPSNFKDEVELPVEQVSFTDVQVFLNKLNARKDGYLYRLPTEAEWEYAARAGTTAPYAGSSLKGDQDGGAGGFQNSGGDDMAWFRNTQTHPVATKKPNAWGIYDMRGNVAEWVQDFYDPNYYSKSPAADPQGPATGDGHVVRGGSFRVYPWLTRVSLRTQFPEDYSLYDVGFRLVRQKR